MKNIEDYLITNFSEDSFVFVDTNEEAEKLKEQGIDSFYIVGASNVSEEDLKIKIAEAVKEIIETQVTACPEEIILFGKQLSKYDFTGHVKKEIEVPEDFEERDLELINLMSEGLSDSSPTRPKKIDVSKEISIGLFESSFFTVKIPGEKIIELVANYYYEEYASILDKIDSRYFNIHPIKDHILCSLKHYSIFFEDKMNDSVWEMLKESELSVKNYLRFMNFGDDKYKVTPKEIEETIIKSSRIKIIRRLGAKKPGGGTSPIHPIAFQDIKPYYKDTKNKFSQIKKLIRKHGDSRPELIKFIKKEIAEEIKKKPETNKEILFKNTVSQMVRYYDIALEFQEESAGYLACRYFIEEYNLGVEPDTLYRRVE